MDTAFGGDGGEGLYQRPIREDTKLIRMAIRQRWPISDEIRAQLPGHLLKIITEGNDERAKVTAAKVMLEADWLNFEVEKFEAEQAKDTEEESKGASATDVLAELAAMVGAQGAAGKPPSGDAGAVESPVPGESTVDGEAGGSVDSVAQ